jgi:hypothetical protein
VREITLVYFEMFERRRNDFSLHHDMPLITNLLIFFFSSFSENIRRRLPTRFHGFSEDNSFCTMSDGLKRNILYHALKDLLFFFGNFFCF